MEQRPRERPTTQAGFTLLELLVVLVIAVMALGVVLPRYSALLPGVQLKGETQQLAALLRQLRSQAIAETRNITLRLADEPGGGVSVSNRESPYLLPESIHITLDGAQSSPMNTDESYIRFFPDGTATGGQILLSGETGGDFRIQVDWLTGRVSIDE